MTRESAIGGVAKAAHSSRDHGEQERIVPGTPMWESHHAEHAQRYEFAARCLTPGMAVLDAGCGVGYGSALLAERGAARVIGVDLSAEALAIARAQFDRPSIRWIAEDCQELAEAGALGPFDLIVNLENLEHLPDPERFLRRVREVLAPRGTFISSTPNRIGTNRLRGLAAGAPSSNPFHCREYTVAEFRSLLEPHFESVATSVQTYDPIERIAFESVLAAVGRNPLLRLGRALSRAAGRPAHGLEAQLPPRRWQILDRNPGDEVVITQLAVCRGPRPAGG